MCSNVTGIKYADVNCIIMSTSRTLKISGIILYLRFFVYFLLGFVQVLLPEGYDDLYF